MELRVYSEADKYITAEEQKWIDRIENQAFVGGTIYINDRGEKRKYSDYKLPYGAKSRATKYLPKERPDDPQLYVTPQCLISEPNAYVYYFDEDGNSYRCTIKEWFDFLGKKFTQEVEPQVAQPNMGGAWLETQKMKQKMLDAQAVKDAKAEAIKEKTDDGKAV